MRIAGALAVITALASAAPAAADMRDELLDVFSDAARTCGAIHRLTARCAAQDLFVEAAFMRHAFFRWAEREGASPEQVEQLRDAWARGAGEATTSACPQTEAERRTFMDHALSAIAECSGE